MIFFSGPIIPGYCKIGTYPYRIVSKNMIIMCKSCFLPYPKEWNWGEGGGHPRPLPTPNFFEKKTDVICVYGPLRFFFFKKEKTKWPPTKENFLGPPLQTSGISLPYTVVSEQQRSGCTMEHTSMWIRIGQNIPGWPEMKGLNFYFKAYRNEFQAFKCMVNCHIN